MKHVFALSAVLMFLVCPGCGGDTHESLAGENITVMKEMVATLDTIKDEATAKAAKPKLKSLAEKMGDLKDRMAKLPAMTEEQGKALISKYGKEMDEIQQKLVSVGMRIQFDPKIRAELADLDAVMSKAMK